MKSKEKILEKLFSLQRFGIKPGLDRIQNLLIKINNPQNNFESIHIAGTNGKGSVSSMIASVLTSSGYKVGLYTSPHILKFNERIKIDGEEIDDDYLINCSEELLRLTQGEEITFFEITTALAFKYYSEKNVDVAVIETGMGGRFDATNIISPILSVITSISFDHQEYLGNSIKEIASEKAGIIKPNIPCITLNRNQEAIDFIRNKCIDMDSLLIQAQESVSFENVSYTNDFKMIGDFSINGKKFQDMKIDLCGDHQIENVQIALAAIENLKSKFNITEIGIKSGFENIKKNTGLFGRIELLRAKPPLVIDVAHNSAAVEKLVNTLNICGYLYTKWNLIFTAMSDKDVQSMLINLLEITNVLMIPNLKIERAMKNNEVSQIAKKVGFQKIELFESVDDMINELINLKEPIIITGSFYLLGEFFSNKNIELLGLEKRIYD
ncbi:MAG: bifunctional folylpolyglutamate synthase/dihydrofolate synthase [Candidatus Kapabacteria bacterium]|nr:bifunctional folylpolyglutamate synthase/dihydrofolate synthase [Candidatus Kapabacteria bacterium]